MRVDYHFHYLEKILANFDGMLGELLVEARESDDPDGMGILDAIESITGLGFVACQNYLIARRQERRGKAWYELGPQHESGLHIATIVNAGANYWKHHPEWPNDESALGPLPLASVSVLRQLDVWRHDYKTMHLLEELVGELRFAKLLSQLDAWRYALDPDGGGFVP